MFSKSLKTKYKSRKYFAIVLLLFIVSLSNAQNDPIPFRKGNKWGYCNKEKQIIIPCRYDSADVFYDCDRAFVKIRGKYGFIDSKGKLVIPAKYEAVGIFRSQYGQNCKAWVTLKGKTVWIDTNVQMCAPPKTFAVCRNPDNLIVPGRIFEKNGKRGMIKLELNSAGFNDTVLAATYDDLLDDGEALIAKLNGKWGMLNHENFKKVLPFEYEAIKPFYTYYLLTGQNGLFGIADKYGNIVIPVKYLSNIQFIEGKPFFKVQSPKGKVGYVGFGGVEYFED